MEITHKTRFQNQLERVKQQIKDCIDNDDNGDASAELEAIEEQIGNVEKKLEEINVKD